MLKTTLAIAAALLTSQAAAADWQSEPNIGAQGVQGAFAVSLQDGLFDLHLDCSAREGENRLVFMRLLTMPDAPIAPGNETNFPVTMHYTFADGTVATSEIEVEWANDMSGLNVWNATFAMDKTFLKNFGQSQLLQLLANGDKIIYQYHMGGSSIAAKNMIEYCYSGDYS